MLAYSLCALRWEMKLKRALELAEFHEALRHAWSHPADVLTYAKKILKPAG